MRVVVICFLVACAGPRAPAAGPVHVQGAYRIEQAQAEVHEGQPTLQWTPNEIDATAHGEVTVERAKLGHLPGEPEKQNWVPRARGAQPSWITDAIAEWMFLLPTAPPMPWTVGATWGAERKLGRDLHDGDGRFQVAYQLRALEACCASIEFTATPMPEPDLPGLPLPNVAIHGTARLARDGRVDEIHATMSFPDIQTVEEWTVRRR